MRLLFAVLFLLNIAYHDTCGAGAGCGYTGRHEAMGGGYGRMGMMWQCPLALGHLGQMGQMLRRNGNVFQMHPIKKNGKMWEFCQNSGGGLSQIPLTFFLLFLQEKLPQNGHKKRADWVKIPIWGGRGGGFPYYFF